MATGATAPWLEAARDSASSSASNSTLKQKIFSFSPSFISASVLPTPEKMMRFPGTPAAKARLNSPSLTMSMPAPSFASVVSTAWFELAFIA